MEQLLKVLIILAFSTISSFAAGSWNGISPSTWNGVAITAWNGTSISVGSSLLTGLAAFWKLDETSGNRSDSTANGQTLTDNNTVGNTTGVNGNAALFVRSGGGSAESLSRTDNATLSVGDIDFSVSLRVKLSSKPGSMSIMGKWATGTLEYLVYYDASDRFYLLVSNNGSAVGLVAANNFGAPSTGTWYHIYAYHDATNNEIGIKINNGTANTASHSGGIVDGTAAFGIGDQIPNASNAFDGAVDDVGIWKRLLTAGEITTVSGGGTYPW
jgi:hypothetical protein